jgi:hypothetical protein
LTQATDFIGRITLDCAGVLRVIAASNHLPDDKDALKTALIETRAKLSGAEAMIEDRGSSIGDRQDEAP